MKHLIERAIAIRTTADVVAFEDEFIAAVGVKQTRFLGDRPTNWSALSSAVDPRIVLFERITNMWDAVIEAEARRVGRFDFHTPREAAHKLLHVPLTGPKDMGMRERAELARRCRVALLDSDESIKRPSVLFRDFGIGVTGTEMPHTILSVEGSNKLDKRWLHGLFGKGGSVTAMYSDAIAVVSRKQPSLLASGEEDRVAVAVVRRDHAPDMRLPFFRYLVTADGEPLSVPASEVDFEPGTLVIHVGYQAGKLGEQSWQYEESIYTFAETALFRPTLPYTLTDERTGKANRRPEDRSDEVLAGLGQRLDKVDTDALHDASPSMARIEVPGVGDVGLRWWLFDDEDKRRRRVAKGHVVVFHTGGQVHHAWDVQRFRTLVPGRNRVANRLVVEVDTETIPTDVRVEIFSSFRDAMLKSDKSVTLENVIADWLENSPEIRDAESQLTRKALQASRRGVGASVLDRLNQAIQAKLPGLGGTRQIREQPDPPPPPKRPEDLYDEPTTFEGPENVTVLVGERKTFYLRCNAKDEFFDRCGAEIELATPADAPDFGLSIGPLHRGRIQASLQAPDGCGDLSTTVEVRLFWLKPSGGTAMQGWPMSVKVATELPERPKRDDPKDLAKRGRFALVWSDPDKEDGWSDQTVGELEHIRGADLAAAQPTDYGSLRDVEDTVPTIKLNERFKDLRAYLNASAPRVLDPTLERRKERYAIAVGVMIANLYTREEKLERRHLRWEQGGNGPDEPPRPMIDEQKARALAEGARGVLALMPDFDQLMAMVEPDEAAAA